MPIPKEEYNTTYGNIPYVTYEQIKNAHSQDECKRFNQWFHGQTGIVTENGTLGIYVLDYERWLEAGMPPQQGKDWD